MIVNRSPEEQARVVAEIQAVESSFAEEFAGMDTYRFIEQGVSIFRAAAEGIPTVNPRADLAVDALLSAIVNGEAPQPSFFGAGRTAAAWRMYTGELVRRVARNQGIEFREIPLTEEPS